MKRWRLILLLVAITQPLPAQLLVVNGVSLTVNSGATITVNGDVEMKGSTSVNNSGTLSLTGDWINNAGAGLFGVSKGTVLMNGNSQHLQGSFATTFYHLTLQNGIKTLHTNISTGGGGAPYNGVLQLNNALLTLKSNMVSVFNSSASAIQRTTGYIISEEVNNAARVYWVNVNAGVHAIPFGNASGEDISFSFTAAPPAGFQEGSLRISTYATLPDNTPYPVNPVTINHVNNTSGTDNSANTVDRFWHIEQNGTCAFTFKYAPSENALNGNILLRAQAWNPLNAGWMMPLAGQTNPTVQQVHVPAVAPPVPGTLQGNTWALALNASPLPVELLSFTAHPAGKNHVICSWTTLTEINNDYFTVERSADGITFMDIGIVDGSGNSHEVLGYHFDDYTAMPGNSYYRLKQTDFDGRFTYSPIVAVRLTSGDQQRNVFPVPADQQLFMSQTDQVITDYRIYDYAGKLIRAVENTNGQTIPGIDIQSFENGMYILEVVNGTIRESFPFTVVHR